MPFFSYQLDPKPRTPYSFLLATKDFHPQSDPIRAPFLVHSYRLLLLLEEEVRKKGKGDAKVVASYDCGEKAGGVEAHKSVRFFVIPSGDLKSESHLFFYSSNHLEKARRRVAETDVELIFSTLPHGPASFL